jgi:hypothetical protein
MLIDVAMPGDRNVIKKESERILKYKERTYHRNSARVECDSKSDTCNTRGDWNHCKISQPILEQHTSKARN